MKYSNKTLLFNEGCFSFPRIYADVERPESVNLRVMKYSKKTLPFNPVGERGEGQEIVLFNPVGERDEGQEIFLVNLGVMKYSKKTLPFNKGCLSFPIIYVDVERPESVKIDAQDINGARFTVDLSGLPDHLQEILFFDRMTGEVLDSIRTQLEALEKKYEDKTGLPSPEKVETRKRKKAGIGFGKSRLSGEVSGTNHVRY